MTSMIDTTNHNDKAADISYRFSFERFLMHLVDASILFTATSDAPELWLPAWIPGSYLMREFARNITAVHYEVLECHSASGDRASKRHRAQKIDKHTWQLSDIRAGQLVAVYYEIYCYDLSVRTAYVDQRRLYGNFTSLALAVAEQEQAAVAVNLVVPAAFFVDKNKAQVSLASGLKAIHTEEEGQHSYALRAEDYHDLIDYPFEISEQDKFDFVIQDNNHQACPHRFYIAGQHHADMDRIQQDVTQICQSYVSWLGDTPFDDYTFMTFASGQDYGGLEHINSTSLITPRRDLAGADEPAIPSADYQRFLGLCSHEYFHSWWVKTVRPDVMLAVDLRREAFTPLLWVFEGFTSYIDDFMLQASGVIDQSSYLTLLAKQINHYYQTAGRAYQSVAESSFDAWIKLYRSDENTGNAGISYYNKGALVALCLDLTLLQKTEGRYRLFDVVKRFYRQAMQQQHKRIGICAADMGAVIGQLMSKADWQDFECRYVNGVEELPIETLLAKHGVHMHHHRQETADKQIPWGMRCTETAAGLTINRVLRDSAAAKAGISAHDVVVAIDGLKADTKQLAHLSTATRAVECHLFRRDELMCVTVLPKAAVQDETHQAHPFPHKVSLRFVGEVLSEVESTAARDGQVWLNVMSPDQLPRDL